VRRPKVAVVGSGNIGTDLMIKVLESSKNLSMGIMVGIDPSSDGLSRAQRLGVATTAYGGAGAAGHARVRRRRHRLRRHVRLGPS
jgi:acetaldehyde dehydrogenase